MSRAAPRPHIPWKMEGKITRQYVLGVAVVSTEGLLQLLQLIDPPSTGNMFMSLLFRDPLRQRLIKEKGEGGEQGGMDLGWRRKKYEKLPPRSRWSKERET